MFATTIYFKHTYVVTILNEYVKIKYNNIICTGKKYFLGHLKYVLWPHNYC